MSDQIYVVKKGDSLWGIGRHYQVGINELMRLNNLHGKSAHTLQIGQQIVLPDDTPSVDTVLSLRILDLAFRPIENPKLKLEFDGRNTELIGNGIGEVGPILIDDHAKGIKIYFRAVDGKYVLIADHQTLPIGRKRLTLVSRRMLVRGNYLFQKGEKHLSDRDAQREIKQHNFDRHIAVGQHPPKSTPTVKTSTSRLAIPPTKAANSTASKPETHPSEDVWDVMVRTGKEFWDSLTKDDGPSSHTSRGVMSSAKATPIATIKQTRVDDGTPRLIVGSIFTEENLHLSPANEKYRKILIAISKKHSLTPHALAALINAEASKLESGEWNSNAKASSSSASGLTQFLNLTWLQVATDKRSLVNQKLKKDNGYEQVNGRWDGKVYSIYGKKGDEESRIQPSLILPWRFIPEYSIDAAAVYGLINIEQLAKKGLNSSGLAPEDLAKLMYLTHHEGSGGAIAVIKGTLSESRAEELLPVQVTSKKAKELAARFNQNYVNAYIHWLYSYIDSKINVTTFMVKPQGISPKPMGDVAALMNGKPASKPTAKVEVKSKAPAGSTGTSVLSTTALVKSNPGVKEGSPKAGGEGPLNVSGWHDPLDTCVIRTAQLRSWKAATFGMVRTKKNEKGIIVPKAHQGIDLVGVPGKTQIRAVAHGIVVVAYKGYKDTKNFGATVVLCVDINDLPEKQKTYLLSVRPNDTKIYFAYCHLSDINVTVGAGPVEAGAVLGTVGDSGNAHGMSSISKGAHLHFEARTRISVGLGLDGRIDPWQFLNNCQKPT
jgi:murein DD-endopeptidase MepM/ murein hydrolase activator NlpD